MQQLVYFKYVKTMFNLLSDWGMIPLDFGVKPPFTSLRYLQAIILGVIST